MHLASTAGIPPLRYVANDSVKMYLLKLMVPQFTEKGHYLVKQGDPPDRIIFLVDGGAVVCRVPLANAAVPPSPRKNQRSPGKGKIKNRRGGGASSSSSASRRDRFNRNSFDGRW